MKIETEISKITDNIAVLQDIRETISTHAEFFTTVFDSEEISFLLITTNGITIYPRDAHRLRKLFEAEGCKFTRTLTTTGVYDWISVFHNIPVTIRSSEFFDQSGTLVTD